MVCSSNWERRLPRLISLNLFHRRASRLFTLQIKTLACPILVRMRGNVWSSLVADTNASAKTASQGRTARHVSCPLDVTVVIITTTTIIITILIISTIILTVAIIITIIIITIINTINITITTTTTIITIIIITITTITIITIITIITVIIIIVVVVVIVIIIIDGAPRKCFFRVLSPSHRQVYTGFVSERRHLRRGRRQSGVQVHGPFRGTAVQRWEKMRWAPDQSINHQSTNQPTNQAIKQSIGYLYTSHCHVLVEAL